LKQLDLIASSLRLIGVLGSGEPVPQELIADTQFVLQGMIDSWQAERLMVFTIQISEFPLVPGQQTYTMGTGGNFNTQRPAKIERISVVQLNNPAQPLELPMMLYTDRDWQSIPVKNITSTLPQAVYDDGSYPLRFLSYWPIPTVAVNTRIYSWEPLKSFPDLSTTDITFPPGYQEALRYNLAMRLIAEMPGKYNQVMTTVTGQLAIDSLARVKSINIPLIELFCDDALVNTSSGRYNIFSDLPVGGRN
jgi:hypothetical protein